MSGPVQVVVLVCAMALLMLMIMKWKVHPFFALLVISLGAGVAFGLPIESVVRTVTGGFGGTIGSIGIVIVLGCGIGIILEETGGAAVIASSILNAIGKSRSQLAMAITGYIVSIPVFVDSGYVITSPIARALSARSKVPLVCLAGALNAGLMASHTLIPPTPGPVAAAGVFEANLGQVIGVGAVAALTFTIVGTLWTNSKFIRNRYPAFSTMNVDLEETTDANKKQPGALLSFGCILVPVMLICVSAFANTFLSDDYSTLKNWLSFIGAPVISLLIGFIMALWLDTSRLNKDQLSKWMTASVEQSGFIIVVTGAAGCFSAILRSTTVGDYIGHLLGQTGLPSVFIPFIIAAILMIALGSATVALMTGAAITMPMMGALGLHPAIATIAVGCGAVFGVHANCSHFWVFTKMTEDMPMEEGYWVVTLQSILGSVAAILVVWGMAMFIKP